MSCVYNSTAPNLSCCRSAVSSTYKKRKGSKIVQYIVRNTGIRVRIMQKEQVETRESIHTEVRQCLSQKNIGAFINCCIEAYTMFLRVYYRMYVPRKGGVLVTPVTTQGCTYNKHIILYGSNPYKKQGYGGLLVLYVTMS